MESKVSGFLSEVLAPEIQQHLFGPALERTFPAAFPLITEVNKAHLLMLVRCGIITDGVGRDLARAINRLEQEGAGAFELDPAREDPYFNYEARLIEVVGSDIGGRLHVARSRNDLKSTQDHLRARALALRIMAELLDLRDKTVAQAERYADIVMPGYTHLQPAQPITFGYFLLGIAHALERDHRRIAECYPRINVNPLGTGALAGTSFPIDCAMTAGFLGFDGVMAHAQDAVASRDCVIELLAHGSLLASTIGRMAQDFYVMTTYEFQTLKLPDSVAITSSIMPQKKNMVVLENLKGRVAQTMGALVTALAGYKATPFSHMQDGNQDGFRWAWEALEEVAAAVAVSSVVVAAAEPQRERMYALVQANFSTVTDLADALVREGGLSFRDAHHAVGRVVRVAIENGLQAHQITADHIARAGMEILGREIKLDEATLRNSLDPTLVAEMRRGTGGPSSEDIHQMITALREQLDGDRTEFTARHESVSKARQRLDETFDTLAKDDV